MPNTSLSCMHNIGLDRMGTSNGAMEEQRLRSEEDIDCAKASRAVRTHAPCRRPSLVADVGLVDEKAFDLNLPRN
jgi:hypothetical protein